MVADLVYLVTEHSYKSVFVGTDDISVFRRMKSLWSQRTDLQYVNIHRERERRGGGGGVEEGAVLFWPTGKPKRCADFSSNCIFCCRHIPLVVVEQEPMLDMVVFTEADMFIGNCASSFTAMATRHRRARDQPLGFWSLVRPESLARDEL